MLSTSTTLTGLILLAITAMVLSLRKPKKVRVRVKRDSGIR